MSTPSSDQSAKSDNEPAAMPSPVESPLGLVKLVGYTGSFAETRASIFATALIAEGISPKVIGGDFGGMYLSFHEVSLYVRANDFEQAQVVLARTSLDALEPVAGLADATPSDTAGIPLAPIGAYESIHSLLDAQAILASKNIKSFLPKLEPRGGRPIGVGKRFILRVEQRDFDAAKSLLADQADEDRDKLRCLRCRSFRVHDCSSLFFVLLRVAGLSTRPVHCRCNACGYESNECDFSARNQQS